MFLDDIDGTYGFLDNLDSASVSFDATKL